MRKNDAVNHPAHYCQGGIECIDAIKAAVAGLTGIEAVCTGNGIKYLWRWKDKNGTEDLRKAAWYINRLIWEIEVGEPRRKRRRERRRRQRAIRKHRKNRNRGK